MYSWLCRVENLISILGYVVPDYVELEISKMWFLAMSFLSTSCKIFHFSFLAMSKNRFLAMSFLAMYCHLIAHILAFSEAFSEQKLINFFITKTKEADFSPKSFI
jgi:hypothetical protein